MKHKTCSRTTEFTSDEFIPDAKTPLLSAEYDSLPSVSETAFGKDGIDSHQNTSGTSRLLESNSFIWVNSGTVETSAEKFIQKKCSNTQTMMNLIKGTAGTGILTLPLVFNNAGLWVGFIGFFVIAGVAVHAMHILTRCAAILEQRSNVPVQDYAHAASQCLEYGPGRLRKWAPTFRMFVSITMNFLQCSFCCIYIVWIAVNVRDVVEMKVWSDSPDIRLYELVVFALLLPYIMVKSLKTLSFFSALANVCYVFGLVVVFQYILRDLPDSRDRPFLNDPSLLPMFFGTVVFAFESICLILPLRDKMKYKEDLGGWGGVLNLSMVVLTVLYVATGFYGALRFGDVIESTITLNLPQGEWLYLSVNLLFSVAVFISVGVQIYVPINTLWPVLHRKLSACYPWFPLTLADCLMRVGLLTIMLVIAVVVPHIEILMAFVGSLFGGLLAVIVPAIIELATLYEEGGLTVFIATKDVLMILMGLTGLASGTYTSVVDIIETF